MSKHLLMRWRCRYAATNKNLPICADVPECISDRDCEQPGKVCVCIEGGTPQARMRSTRSHSLSNDHSQRCDLWKCVTPIRLFDPHYRSFPGAAFQTVDMNSERGQNLMARYRLDRVPAYVLNNEFEKTTHFNRFAHLMQRVDDHFVPTTLLTPIARGFSRPEYRRYGPVYGCECVSSITNRRTTLAMGQKKSMHLTACACISWAMTNKTRYFGRHKQTAPDRIVDALLCHQTEGCFRHIFCGKLLKTDGHCRQRNRQHSRNTRHGSPHSA